MLHRFMQQETEMCELIRIISLYRVLTLEQIVRLFPNMKPETLISLLVRLSSQGRIYYEKGIATVSITKDAKKEAERIAAFWVLLDFFPKVTYHTTGDFPALVTFFAGEDAYEIIYCAPERETMLNHALSLQAVKDTPHRLVIVKEEHQIPLISIPGIAAYCMVLPDGSIQYYKKLGVDNINHG